MTGTPCDPRPCCAWCSATPMPGRGTGGRSSPYHAGPPHSSPRKRAAAAQAPESATARQGRRRARRGSPWGGAAALHDVAAASRARPPKTELRTPRRVGVRAGRTGRPRCVPTAGGRGRQSSGRPFSGQQTGRRKSGEQCAEHHAEAGQPLTGRGEGGGWQTQAEQEKEKKDGDAVPANRRAAPSCYRRERRLPPRACPKTRFFFFPRTESIINLQMGCRVNKK